VIARGGHVGTLGSVVAILITAAVLLPGVGAWLAETYIAALTELPPPVTDVGGLALHSLAMFGAFVLLVATVVFAVWRGQKLYDEDHDADKSAYWGNSFTMLLGFAVFSATLWWSRGEPAGAIAFNVLLFTLLVALAIALVLLATLVGAKGQRGRTKLGFAFLGAFHFLMHVVPVANLIKAGNPNAYAVVVVASVAFAFVGRAIVRRPTPWSRWAALGAWLLYGAVLIAVPLLLHHPAYDPSPWYVVVGLAVALVVGFFHGCNQFGWYLAVCHGFDGHNNEVGGAARVSHYAQFIRFRVEPDRLTGYVIGVDRQRERESRVAASNEPQPILCDVFSITTRPK
jgi:hypothetical protein